jgi:hypothetical protein
MGDDRSDRSRFAVIGAGLAGLCAAGWLAAEGLELGADAQLCQDASYGDYLKSRIAELS